MWPRSTSLLLLAAGVCFAALPPLPLHSADIPATDSEPASPAAAAHAPNLPALFKALRSDDYKTREDATTALLRLSPDARSDIEHAISTETDEEALSRLIRVAIHLFLKDPLQTPMDGQASLLGITLNVEPLHINADGDEHKTAIVVMDTKPGFPAYEVLKPGDRIVAIDNQPLLDYSFDMFKARVGSRLPGTFLNTTVRRDGKEFKAAIRLAGLRRPGEAYLVQFVDQRARDSADYLSHLQQSLSPRPLVLKDDTPPEINIYNDMEMQEVP